MKEYKNTTIGTLYGWIADKKKAKGIKKRSKFLQLRATIFKSLNEHISFKILNALLNEKQKY